MRTIELLGDAHEGSVLVEYAITSTPTSLHSAVSLETNEDIFLSTLNEYLQENTDGISSSGIALISSEDLVVEDYYVTVTGKTAALLDDPPTCVRNGDGFAPFRSSATFLASIQRGTEEVAVFNAYGEYAFTGNPDCSALGFDFGWKLDRDCVPDSDWGTEINFEGGYMEETGDNSCTAGLDIGFIGSFAMTCSDPDGGNYRLATITQLDDMPVYVIMKGGNGGVIYNTMSKEIQSPLVLEPERPSATLSSASIVMIYPLFLQW